jgi:hypothetical protein
MSRPEGDCSDAQSISQDSDSALLVRTRKRRARDVFPSSYDLFDLVDDRGKGKRKRKRNYSEEEEEEEEEEGEINSSEESIEEEEDSFSDEMESVEEEEELNLTDNVSSSNIVDAAISNSTTVQTDASITNAAKSANIAPESSTSSNSTTSIQPLSLSNWLTRFLSTKRDPNNIPEPEDLPHTSDIFLSSFHTGLEYEKLPESESESESEDGIVHIDSIDSEEDIPADSVTVTIFNLPYVTTKESLIKILTKHGLKIKSAVVGSGDSNDEKKKGLNPGMASVEVMLTLSNTNNSNSSKKKNDEDTTPTTASNIISTIHGLNIQGRIIRACLSDSKRRQSLDNNRYFEENISVKCSNCNQVGHTQVDCTLPIQPLPCHLCAGRDHESIDCTNIVCYRCQKIGHHSRDCKQDVVYKATKPSLCLYCSSTRHDSIYCSYYMDIEDKCDELQSDASRCLDCYATGHVTCSKKGTNSSVATSSDGVIYCPNCGDMDHSIDICKQSDIYQEADVNLSYCSAPKHDAFIKYNHCKLLILLYSSVVTNVCLFMICNSVERLGKCCD